MSGNILLVFDDFDPVTNYKLKLISESQKIESFTSVICLYESFKGNIDRVFQPEERIFLLSSSLPNSPSPSIFIDGDSFTNEKQSISEKIIQQKTKHKKAQLYLLLDSKEYQILENSEDGPTILSNTQIVLYILPEHKELMESYSVTSKPILFINPTPEINELSKASILEVTKEGFPQHLIEYMNKSNECAIKRIKTHLSTERFKHCLRVAGMIKGICETVEVEDQEFCYDAYMAALYHDICKEMPKEIQESIAKNILGMEEGVSGKVLHGPIAAGYLKTKYHYYNEDVLEAISQHTVPAEYPKRITMFLYLADRLEVGKKDRYPKDVYDKAGELIDSKKPIEAFNFMINYCHEAREKRRKEREGV